MCSLPGCVWQCAVLFLFINSFVYLYVGNSNDVKDDDDADISKLYCDTIWSMPDKL